MRKKRVYLTPAGQRLLPYAEAVYRSALAAEQVMRSEGQNVRLDVGVASALTLSVLPVVEKLRRLWPSMDVTLTEGTSTTLLEDLRECRLHACVVARLEAAEQDLLAHRLPWRARVALIASRSHPLTQMPAVSWEDLADYPLILRRKGSVARELIMQELDRRSLRVQVFAEIDNLAAVSQLVEETQALALVFLPDSAVDILDEALQILHLESGDLFVGVHLVTRVDGEMTPVIQAFLELLEAGVGAHGV